MEGIAGSAPQLRHCRAMIHGLEVFVMERVFVTQTELITYCRVKLFDQSPRQEKSSLTNVDLSFCQSSRKSYMARLVQSNSAHATA